MDAFACGEFAPFVLGVNTFLTTAQMGFSYLLIEEIEFILHNSFNEGQM
jgi:hypothetical protein